jgi:transcription antitermination factor NusG
MSRIPPSLDDFNSQTPIETGRWYVLTTFSRQEKRACEAIAEMIIEPFEARPETYLPLETYKHTLTHRQRLVSGKEWEARQRPVLPGYVFVKLTDGQIGKAKAIDVVTGIISDRGRPVPIQLRDLMWLAWFEGTGEFDLTYSVKKERWKPRKGENARVTKGHYAGFEGPITELRGKNRAAVLLTLFGRSKPIDIPIVELEAA